MKDSHTGSLLWDVTVVTFDWEPSDVDTVFIFIVVPFSRGSS
jgi:hypothetical protein